ncbi:hypothetical protein H0E87_025398 [Populus deltoides]|uniref:Uncharacterized protein n=1 Tax=Populus deltoides TaxID=3696 RepID=A0A8T2X2J8_POPDE|nr:hypothetical protein H0E87_025398 [Populus deltoides]
MVGGGYVGWWLEKGGSAMEEVVGHSEVRAKMGGYLMRVVAGKGKLAMGSCCAVVVEEGIEEVVAEKGVVHGRLSLNWKGKEAFVTNDRKQTGIVGVKRRIGL